MTNEEKELVRTYAKSFAFKWMNEYIDSLGNPDRDPQKRPPHITREDIEALEKQLGLNEVLDD